PPATRASTRSPTGSRPWPRPSGPTPIASRRRWTVSTPDRSTDSTRGNGAGRPRFRCSRSARTSINSHLENSRPMEKLSHDNLYSLEQYARLRGELRARGIEHKKPRRASLGSNLNLYFEDRLTMQYQVQEMLRIERIFEPEAIDDELGAYNPLIPDGDNLKATMMLEYADVDERKQALSQLIGIENRVFIKVDDLEPVYAIADEDLERADAGKTSSVHFLRFQFDDEA